MLFWGMKENTHASDKGKEKRTIRPWRGRQFRATSPSIPREEEDPAHDHIICWDLPRRGSRLLPGEAFFFFFLKKKISYTVTKITPTYWFQVCSVEAHRTEILLLAVRAFKDIRRCMRAAHFQTCWGPVDWPPVLSSL